MNGLIAKDNEARQHGVWGEDVAAEYLRRAGFEIVDRNARPVKRDHRLEIDLVAWDRPNDTMVFVEVKQHRRCSIYARRLQKINVEKRDNLRRACHAWRREMKWPGSFRFDVIEVYGEPGGGKPIIDHISNVNLFVEKERFVKWN